MKVTDCRFMAVTLLLVASMTQLFSSCESPFKWNADLKNFVDDGQSILKLNGFTAKTGDEGKTIIPSGQKTVLTLDILNPRSIKVSCDVRCADASLFDALPEVVVSTPQKVSFSFTPSLLAERKDLVFSVGLSSPEIENTFPAETITIHCNTAPGSAESTLDAALDAGGFAFVAFRLPSAPTDDDIAQIKIRYAPVDGSGSGGMTTFAVNEACLCSEICTVGGKNLLGASGPLNRYYKPSEIGSGDNYLFTVVVVDSEGLESTAAEISSDATLYAVTYEGNGNSAGIAPEDTRTYRHTKPFTVLGQGTLGRSGFTFAGWTDAADGSGTAYAPGSVNKMEPKDLRLYAVWVQNEAVPIAFSVNPSHAIVFASSTASVKRGEILELKLSDPLTGATDWNWYVNNVHDTTQTTSTFTWDSTNAQPGQFTVNVDAVYEGYVCTGSIRVTVTYGEVKR